MASQKLDSVISLAKRRGFVFQAGEIYGGSRSAWDYGPLGVELKENIKRQWWHSMVSSREDVVDWIAQSFSPRRSGKHPVTLRPLLIRSSSAPAAIRDSVPTTLRKPSRRKREGHQLRLPRLHVRTVAEKKPGPNPRTSMGSSRQHWVRSKTSLGFTTCVPRLPRASL